MRTPFLFALAASAAALTTLQACSDDPEPATVDTPDASTTRDASRPSTDSSTDDPPDAGPTDSGTGGDACDDPPATVVLDGGGPCGTLPFGEPAAPFGGVMGDGGAFTGGTLPPGIYDAKLAERGSGQGGSWRETFVVDGTRFTRIRQIDTGSGGGPGPVTYRSGTYTTNGQTITLSYDCAQSGDAGVDAGQDNLPFDVVPGACGRSAYRYGATGIRITLERR